MLWKEAGVTTLDDLEGACRSGRIAGLPRMGAKTVEKILAAIDAQRQTGGKQRRPRESVAPLVEALLAALRSLPTAQRAEVAGSYRRGRDTVGDVDLLVATGEPRDVLVSFAALPQVETVLLRGDTKCSVVIDGLQVDCRAVAPEQFGAAWQYFTGSQMHNIKLRGMALRLGLTLNEYGVFRVDDGTRVAGETEEDVYESLGLRWIPPEQREDRGEVEAARIETAGVSSSAASSSAEEG
jgi:DNA polymerase (family 10)